MHTGLPEGQARSWEGLLPQDLIYLVEVGVESVYCLCQFFVFLSLRVFSLGLLLVGLALILKML